MSINDEFRAYVAQRGQELADAKAATPTPYEQQQQRAAEGGELFTGLFAQLDAQTTDIDAMSVVTADPAVNDFNKFFGL